MKYIIFKLADGDILRSGHVPSMQDAIAQAGGDPALAVAWPTEETNPYVNDTTMWVDSATGFVRELTTNEPLFSISQ